MPPESIEVPASEENGNVPAETIAPVTPPATPAPAAVPAESATPAEPEQFELPDGRKVDGATLAREFKENFLPDYTKKSQELARLTKTPKTEEINKPEANPLASPEYAPQSYDELAKIIEERTIGRLKAEEKAKLDERLAIENTVKEQLDAVKSTDKTIDENKLFMHATKYHFTDLRLAHQNMKDMEKMAKDLQQKTAKDVLKRQDPVSVIPGASGGTRLDPSMFENAVGFLRSLQK